MTMMMSDDEKEKVGELAETAEIPDEAFEEEWESEEEGLVVEEKDKDDPSAFGDDGLEE